MTDIRQGSPGRARALKAVILATSLFGVLGSLALFYYVHGAESDRTRVRFMQEAQDRASALEARIANSLQSLVALESLYLVYPEVDGEVFREFARHLLEHDVTIQALEWIPRVANEDRADFEESRRRSGLDGFQITERQAQGRMIRAPERREYFPVTLVEPLAGNEIALGFDVASEPVRRAALENARVSAEAAASSRVKLVQEKESAYGILVFTPIYDTASSPGDKNLEGFLLGVFRPGDMMNAALAALEPRGIDLILYDEAAPREERLLHFHRSRLRDAGDPVGVSGVEGFRGPRLEWTFDVANRKWRLVAVSTPLFLAAGQSWTPWGVLFGGLLLTALLTAYLALVVQRAEELRRFSTRLLLAKQDLEKEVEERARKETEAEESKQRYEALAEASFDGVAITEGGVIVEANEAFARTFGYGIRELQGLPVTRLVSPDLRGDVERKIAAQYEQPYESVCVRRNGERFPVEVCGKATFYQGRPARVTSLRDLSEAKRHEQDRLRAEKLSSLGLLAGGLAHDFNNLLTAIIGNINLARRDSEPGGVLEKRLNEAEQASMRAADLTHQLLTFSKGGAPIKEVSDLAQIIRESATFASRGSNVRCDFAIPADLWLAEVDHSQISQVVSNLVLNAVQAMPQGGTIRVSCDNARISGDGHPRLQPGDFVRITVADEGVGIAPEHLPNVFDPYFTTKEKGSGLGLATAHSVIERHNGIITVDSRLGSGSTFTIFLPASSRDPVRRGPEAPQAAGTSSGRVLVMDDEEAVRKVVCEMLERLDYEVSSAADGAEAIDLYLESTRDGSPIDAVILDVTVPGGMGGLETLRRLLKIDPDVAAIASSGYAHEPSMARFAEHGFRAVIPKPYALDELADALRKVLSSRPSVVR